MKHFKYPIDKQVAIFVELILKNKNIVEILNRGFIDEIPDWYLVAGCLNQTIWNQLTNKELDKEIKDYDLIYFDTDTSAEKETSTENAIREKYKNLKVNIDVKNQARVHLWTEKRMGFKMRPLLSCEDAIASWPNTVSSIGIRKNGENYKIMAPYGLTDSLEMILRPNKTTVMKEEHYYNKVNKWKQKWPELTLIDW